MSIVIEIENVANLDKARAILGAKSNSETLERALEKVIENNEPVETVSESNDLPDSYWEDLFSEPQLPGNAASQAVIDERNEARY